MTTRQISETIENIYRFETSENFISDVTDCLVLKRPLQQHSLKRNIRIHRKSGSVLPNNHKRDCLE